jgi:hypothetical protein
MPLIQRRVRVEEWRPVGIEALEDNALEVVKSTNNRSVIAGPGSGKTELLAQRASYLLQCSISDPPWRILAISFKRDAAANLGRRVRSRCHPAQARRFDSLTFDAFARGSWIASAKRFLSDGGQPPTTKSRMPRTRSTANSFGVCRVRQPQSEQALT